MRKTTRRTLKSLSEQSGGQASLEDLRSLLTGTGAGSKTAAALVTMEPVLKKKLRYTFNTEVRKQRLADDLEDETDDEALDAAETAAAAKKRADEEAAEEDEDAAPAPHRIEQSGMKKNPEKPLPKREMTTQHYEWAVRDEMNPNAAGAYDVIHKPSASRQRWLDRKKNKRGGKGLKGIAVRAGGERKDRMDMR
jgi:hypothetical protein